MVVTTAAGRGGGATRARKEMVAHEVHRPRAEDIEKVRAEKTPDTKMSLIMNSSMYRKCSQKSLQSSQDQQSTGPGISPSCIVSRGSDMHKESVKIGAKRHGSSGCELTAKNVWYAKILGHTLVWTRQITQTSSCSFACTPHDAHDWPLLKRGSQKVVWPFGSTALQTEEGMHRQHKSLSDPSPEEKSTLTLVWSQLLLYAWTLYARNRATHEGVHGDQRRSPRTICRLPLT